MRDLPLAVIAENEAHVHHMTKLVFNWSKDVMVFTNGQELSPNVLNDFKRNHINFNLGIPLN